MKYNINFSKQAEKTFKKLERQDRLQIFNYIHDVIGKLPNPRSIGKALIKNKKGLWRYRTGHFRIICQINDNVLTILIVDIGHRKNIYL